MTLQSGLVVLGRYRFTTRLGSGSFGEVWAATDQATRESVAVKILATTGTPKQIERFKHEFSLLTRLAHPHINRVLDFGHEPDVGHVLIAERVRGRPMMDVAKGRPYPDLEALFAQALRALAYLHAHGVYHFDIKPANLLVEPDAHGMLQLKVIDFGLAALRPIMERTGTPSFMAPEVVLAEPADGRADLYALGVTFYMCVAGTNPFRGGNHQETWGRHLQLVPEPLSKAAPGVPTYIDALVARLFEKRPTDRYASAAQCLRDLQLLSPAAYAVEVAETRASYAPAGALAIGQSTVKAAITQHLQWEASTSRPANPILLLTGGAAMGKTTLLRWTRYEAALAGCRVLTLAGPTDPELAWWVDQVTALLVGGASPVVLLLDDLDACLAPSADPTLRPVLRALFELLAAGLLPHVRVVATARERPLAVPDTATVVATPPFTEAELADYLAAVVPLDPGPRADLARRLAHQTGGHPGLVAHAVRALLAQGYLVDASGAWGEAQFADIAIDLTTVSVPSQLQDERRALLEQVSPAWRDAAAWLAAWDEPITVSTLHAVAGDSIAAWHAALQGLVHLQLVHADPATGTYHLADAGVQTAITALTPAAARRQHHRTIAHYLQTVGAPEIAVDRHWAQSDDASADAALVRWSVSMQQQAHAGRAITALQHRLAAADVLPDARATLTFTLARLCLHADRCPEGRTAVEALLTSLACDAPSPLPFGEGKGAAAQAAALPAAAMPAMRRGGALRATTARVRGSLSLENPILFESHEWLGRLHLRAGDVPAAQHAFTQALTTCTQQSPPDPVWTLRLENDLALCTLHTGDAAGAAKKFRETQIQAQRLTPADRERVTNNDLGLALFWSHDYAAARTQFEHELCTLPPDGAHYQRANRRYYLGEALCAVGDYTAAREHMEAAATLAKTLQDLRLLGTIYNGLGNVGVGAGEVAVAEAAYERGLTFVYRLGDTERIVGLSLNLARVHLLRDALPAAEGLLRGLQMQLDHAGLTARLPRYRIPLYHLLGECLRRRRQWEPAAAALREAWELATADAPGEPYRFSIATTHAEMARDQGDRATAQQWLATARPYCRSAQEQQVFAEFAKSLATDSSTR